MTWPTKSAFNRKSPKKKRKVVEYQPAGHGLAERIQNAQEREAQHERAVAKILRGRRS